MDVLFQPSQKLWERSGKIRSSLYKEIEDMLMEWLQQDFIEGVQVYGTVLREKDFCSVRHQYLCRAEWLAESFQ
jgi:hypothetical protein